MGVAGPKDNYYRGTLPTLPTTLSGTTLSGTTLFGNKE